VSGRIYRTAWAVVALPLLVAAFTVGRPDALPKPDLPPSFDQTTAVELARDFAESYPDRSPGGANATGAADWVTEHLEAYHLNVETQRFQADIPGRGLVTLVNLIARPSQSGPAHSPETIVIMADRDNLGVDPGLDRNASGTAALVELARELSTLTVTHTIVFVSTDGGAWGGLGAAKLAHTSGFTDDVLAVVNLDAVASDGAPRIELAGEDSRSPAAAFVATADASMLDETETAASHANAFEQLLDLAFPFSLYGQAPLLGGGTSALTLTTAGDRPPTPDEDAGQFRPARLGAIGRAAQALVVSLDDAPEVASGTESYVYLGGRVLRGFAIQLLLLVAFLPVAVATIDLYARLRRRELALGPALRSYRGRLGVWLWGGGLAALYTAFGAFPNGEARPLPPDLPDAQRWPFAALASLLALAGLGWLLARSRLVPRAPVERSDELAGHLAGMLVLCVIAIAVAATNVYALLLVLPSLHAWLWIPHARDAHPATRALVFTIGLAGPIALVAGYAIRFQLGLDAPWYLATLFTTGYAPIVQGIALLAWGAVAAQLGAVLFGRYAPYPSEGERPVRGVVREGVRQTILLSRRIRRRRSGGQAAERPPGTVGVEPARPEAQPVDYTSGR
jgi:hypothetical protein